MLRRLARDQRVRYVGAGAFGAAVYYGAFTAGWLALAGRLPYPVVTVLASTLTAVVLYPVQRCVVFRTAGPVLAGFLRFYVVCLWALVFTLGGLWTLVELVGLPVMLAQAVVVALNPLVNYQLGRLWVFRRRPRRPATAPVAPALTATRH